MNDELKGRVDILETENSELKAKVDHLNLEVNDLRIENNGLKIENTQLKTENEHIKVSNYMHYLVTFNCVTPSDSTTCFLEHVNTV